VQFCSAADPSRPPTRPDFSALTPAQAEKADAEYKAALKEWERIDEPRRKAAIEEAVKIQETRKEQWGNPTRKPTPVTTIAALGSDYKWEADAQSKGLDEATCALLRRENLAITGESFKQSFSVYMDTSYVPFVTSDSLLNGFHVLLEATLRRYELRRAQRLRATLEYAWNGLERRLAEEKLPRSTVAPYVRHLALVIGPALRLLGSNAPLGDPALETEVGIMVKKINDAGAVELPVWLAPSEPMLTGIDYRRCRPLGFYTDNPVLADYYRAVRWLQMVPLRASRPNEAGAAALLADLSAAAGSDGFVDFVKDGAQIWGKAEDLDLATFQDRNREFLSTIAKSGTVDSALVTASKNIRDQGKWYNSKVNDRIRAMPNQAGDIDDPAVIILAPSVLPDSKFLEEIAASRRSDQPFPQGLEVAAWLGSDFAMNSLPSATVDKISNTRSKRWTNEDQRPYWGSPVPDFYYYTLQALFEPADPTAPAFVKSEAWQRKSLQTALAGWVQLRHAWELQTKLNVSYACGHTRPAGLIEPNPEFFRRMNTLTSVIVGRFQDAQVFSKVPQDEVDFLHGWLRMIDRFGLRKVDMDWGELSMEEGDCLLDVAWSAAKMGRPLPGISEIEKYRGEQQRVYWTQVYETLKARIAALERGERLPALDSRQFRFDPDQNLFSRWQSLQTLTVRFEAMLQKQLRSADWSED
jgi:hypothetical protein